MRIDPAHNVDPARTPSRAQAPGAGPVADNDPADRLQLGGTSELKQLVSELKAYKNDQGVVPLIISSLTPEEQKAAVAAANKCSSKSGVEALPLVDGITANIPADKLQGFLKSLPASVHLGIDQDFNFAQPAAPSQARADIFETADSAKVTPTHTSEERLAGLDSVHSQGFEGQGQTGVLIDSGVFPHPDLKGRLKTSVDFTDPTRTNSVDTLGHGTADAGIMFGDGTASSGQIMGVAPKADFVSLRIGSISDAIKALQWCIENKDKQDLGVINMSLGDTAKISYRLDPFAQAVQKAIDAGLWVVVSAGNNGSNAPDGKSSLPNGTITTPGDLPDAITVGAIDDHGSADISKHTVPMFASEGPTIDGLQKPDYVTNGINVFAPLSPDSSLDQPDRPHVGQSYQAFDGSSQAAPTIAAFLLLMRQANPNLTLAQARRILDATAEKIPGVLDVAQGKGEVQADKAIAMAVAMAKGDPGPAANAA